ncbi:MAG: metalloregulator ArsR/SmtB family transcription factor [Candidatus Methylomirabilota bacterium]
MPLKQMVVEEIAGLFGVLAHPTRVRILKLLSDGEHDVSDIRARLDVPATNASQHLALLRSHRLVAVRREGNHLFYCLRDPQVAELINRALDLLDTDKSQAPQLREAIDLVRIRG